MAGNPQPPPQDKDSYSSYSATELFRNDLVKIYLWFPSTKDSIRVRLEDNYLNIPHLGLKVVENNKEQ